MKKKRLAALLVMAVVLSMAACGIGKENSRTDQEEPGKEIGDASGEEGGEDPGDASGEENGEDPGDASGEGSGEDPGDASGEESGEGTGDAPGENGAEDPGDPTSEVSDKTMSWVTGNVTATLNVTTGTMTLSGSGGTEGYVNGSGQPWAGYLGQIKTLVVESGVTVMGSRLFYGATKLKEVTIADTVTTIGEGVFRDCISLEYIEIPAGVTTLGRQQFYSCTSLKEVVIRGNITTLNEMTFAKCTKLTTVTLPASLTSQSIKSGNKTAFYACSSLSNIYYGGTVEAWKTLVDSDEYGSVLKTSAVTVVCSDGTYTYEYIYEETEG